MNLLIFTPVLPEIAITIVSMFLLIIGVFKKNEKTYTTISNLAILSLLAVLFLIFSGSVPKGVSFGGSLITDSFSLYLNAFNTFQTLLSKKNQKIARFD